MQYTFIADNEKELAKHAIIAKQLGMGVSFAHHLRSISNFRNFLALLT